MIEHGAEQHFAQWVIVEHRRFVFQAGQQLRSGGQAAAVEGRAQAQHAAGEQALQRFVVVQRGQHITAAMRPGDGLQQRAVQRGKRVLGRVVQLPGQLRVDQRQPAAWLVEQRQHEQLLTVPGPQ